MRELEAFLETQIIGPRMYPHILNIVDGHHVLIPCPCALARSIQEPPYLPVYVPKDYLAPSARFRNFKESPSNQDGYDYCKGWADAYWARKDFPAPLLCGPVGTGKTRLIWTVLNEISIRMQDYNQRLYDVEKAKAIDQEDIDPRPPYRRFTNKYVTMPQFAEKVRLRARNLADVVAYRKELNQADILAIDDIGAENATELVREQLYLLVDERVKERKPMLVACNFKREEIAEWLGSRILSRLEGSCDIVEVHGTDQRAKEKARRSQS